MKILVIGAGIGGLALAQGLTKSGFNVTVFERDETATSRVQGYRITMRSLGMAALSSLLSEDKLTRLASAKVKDVGDGFTFANEKMQPLLKIPPGQDAAVQFLRSELRKILQDGIRVEWNKRIVSIDDTGHQVVAHFDDGSQATGDFLVGCDGGSSAVRELLPKVYGRRIGSVPAVADVNGVVFTAQIERTSEWEGLLPQNRTGMVRFLGPGTNYMGVCFSERADRTPTVFWGLTDKIQDRNAPWLQFDGTLESRKQILLHCQQIVRSGPWHDTLQKLICETPLEGILTPWIFRTTQFPDEPNHFPIAPSGRVTIMGDAAHVMPPGQGLGGSHVLEDARLLVELLTTLPKPLDWPALTEKFERQMFARARKVVQESNSTDESHSRIRMIPPSES